MLKLYKVYDTKSELYDVRLNGEQAELMEARVSAVPYGCHWPGMQRPLSQTEIAPFLRAETDGHVDVRVRMRTGANVLRARVAPLSSGVHPEVESSEIVFTLPGPGAYVLDVNRGRQPLTILLSPPEEFDGKRDLYFGPGEHTPGCVRLESNQTVYIHAEAVVYGSFIGVNVQNTRIVGYGVIDSSHETRADDTPLHVSKDAPTPELCGAQEFYARLSNDRVLTGGVRFYGCTDVEVRGITFRDAATAALEIIGCERVRVMDVKAIGMWKYDARGVCVINSADVRIEGGFLRTFGDCVTVRGLEPFRKRACERVYVRRTVLWCDWGCALGIGPETHAKHIRDVSFEDSDLIRGAHTYMDIRHQDEAEIIRVDFKDIRLEYAPEQRVPYYQTDMLTSFRAPRAGEITALANASIFDPPSPMEDHKHGEIRDIRFRDIALRLDEGVPMPEIRFSGLGGKHMVKNAVVERLYVNGMRVTNSDDANIMVNAYASKIVFL